MKITFCTYVATAHGCFNPGDTAEIPNVNAEEYIRLGYAEPLKNIENAMVSNKALEKRTETIIKKGK